MKTNRASAGERQFCNLDQKGNSPYLIIISAVLIVLVLAFQMMSYSQDFIDLDLMEIVDFEENEGEEKNNEENENEKKEWNMDDHYDSDLSYSLTHLGFWSRIGIPQAPYLESISPPPDQI